MFSSKITYFFLFTASIFLFSCGNNQSNAKALLLSSIAAQNDSIQEILTEIHADKKTHLLDSLFTEKAKTAGFNGCVLIAQRGQIIYKNAFGFSNLKTKDSLNINSAFQLASTSKPLTAAAVLLLKDQGKLKLTDKMQQFFPDFPYPNITLQLLLSHRSGLGNYLYYCEPYCDKNNCYNGKTFDNNSMMEIILNDKPPLYAPPNKKFEYCNTNYALLAMVIEKISKLTYADFMEENIFKPLGMNNTWVHSAKNDSIHKNKTIGHNASGLADKDVFADDVVGDKGIYSTVEDLFKWNQALYSEKILKKKTIEEAYTGYSNEHKGRRNYGLGWRLNDDGSGGKIVYHNGWWHGYSSLFFRRLSDQTNVIVLSNRFNSSTYHIEDVLAILNNSAEPIEIAGEE